MRNILAILLFATVLHSQTPLDSLALSAQVDSLLHAAYARTEANDLTNALDANLKAENLILATLGKNSAAYGSACTNHGRILANQGAMQEAESWYLEAKDIQKNVPGTKHPDYALTLNLLATLYSGMGDYASAEPLFLEARSIWEKALGPENEFAGWSAQSLGTLYHRMQNYKKAERFYKEANRLRRKALGPEHPYYAITLCSQASLYMQMGNYTKAESFYLEAKAIQEKALGKLHPDYAHTLDGLAVLYDDYLKNIPKAEVLYLEVMSIREQTLGKNHPDFGWSLGNMGSFYWYHGQYAKAEPLLLQANQLWASTLGKKYIGYSWSLHKLWALYWSMGDYAKAQACETERNQLEKAELMRSAYHLSGEELSLFIRRFQDGLEEDFSFAYSKKGDVGICYDDAIFYKGFLLNTLHQLRALAVKDSLNAAQFARLQDCERQLAMEYSKPLTEQQSIPQLEETAIQLEKDLAQHITGFKEALQQVNWQAVQQHLQPGEVALEFVHFKLVDPRPTDSILYAALLLSVDLPNPLIIPLCEEKQLAAGMQVSDQSPINRINALYTEASLFDLIWRPIDLELRKLPGFSNAAESQQTIYFSPSGLLHYLNLTAIPIPDASQNRASAVTLADRYHLIELRSTRQLGLQTPAATPIPEKTRSGLLYGGIQYDIKPASISNKTTTAPTRSLEELTNADSTLRSNRWDYLKWTDVEVSAIADLLSETGAPIELRRGYDASEESFKALGKPEKPSPSILHLATHGFFYPEPPAGQIGAAPAFKYSSHPMIRAGLVLAGGNAAWTGNASSTGQEDGILTAYEISQMHLNNTELVVLSACETGLGAIQGNEGVYGLQRAFKIAGVKYLIMSLWQVPDFQTQELMTTFYSHWIADKMTIPEAFRVAQKAMRDKYKDPFLWAGFVLVE